MLESIKHILVIRLSAMGDVAMTVPLLKALTQVYPKIKITVLTKEFFAPFFDQLTNVTVKFAKVEGTHKGVLGIYKLYKELEGTNIDAVVDLHNVLRSNLLKSFFKLSNIPFVQIDKGREEKKALTRWKNKNLKPLKSAHERYLNTFQLLGFRFELSAKAVLKREPLDVQINTIVGDANIKKWIGIAPFAQHKGKEYDFNLMLQVIEELNRKENFQILLFGGGKEEIDLLDNTAQKYKNVSCIAGKLTLKQELQLISNLDIMLSMDSGNGHLAAMYGIPVITIWGVTHPYAGFVPFAQPKENSLLPNLVIYNKIPTSIYGNKIPKGYENVSQSIMPKIILNRIFDTLM